MKKGEQKMKKNLAKNLEPQKMSYADLLKIDDDKRYELIDGVLFVMESPRVAHQDVLGELYYQLKNYLKGKKCRVFVAPLDVKLSGVKDDTKEYNVVQPDIMVICDKNKITEKNIQGVPDFAIEITSPTNAQHDKIRKLNLYQEYGVKEYWIVSLEEQMISVFLLNEDKIYTIPRAYYLDEKIKVNVLEDCYIDLKDFCKENNIEIKINKEDEEIAKLNEK